MDDCAWDPVALFMDVGMLIIEARIPDHSPKGRIEGMHCPPVHGGSQGSVYHKCDKHREQCRKAEQLRDQMIKMCRNRIPMCIDVLLLPDCDHGRLEASTVEGSSVTCTDDIIVLERWEVLLQKKRNDRVEAGSVTGKFLLQALRSFLHFSQLSSWLISNRGYLPLQFVYRLYAPGETVSHGFSENCDFHNFPPTDLGTDILKVSVASIQRQQCVPILLCQDQKGIVTVRKKYSPDRDHPHSVTVHKKYNPDRDHPNSVKAISNLSIPTETWSKKTEELRRTSPELFNKNSSVSQQNVVYDGAWSKKTEELRRTSPELFIDTSLGHTQNINYEHCRSAGAIPKSKTKVPDYEETKEIQSKPPVHRKIHNKTQTGSESSQETCSDVASSLKMAFKKKPLPLSPEEVQKNSGYLMTRLPSPKVLFTTAHKSSQKFYKKKQLNFDSPPESFEDKVLASSISSLVKPLNSDDLEAYLASLSQHVQDRSTINSLGSIPTTHCKFYVGEECNDSRLMPLETEPNKSIKNPDRQKFDRFIAESKSSLAREDPKPSLPQHTDTSAKSVSSSQLHSDYFSQEAPMQEKIAQKKNSNFRQGQVYQDTFQCHQTANVKTFQKSLSVSEDSQSSLFSDFLSNSSSAKLDNIPVVNTQICPQRTESRDSSANVISTNNTQFFSEKSQTTQDFIPLESRTGFKKSLSEPGLGSQLSLCQLEDLNLSPDEKLSDLDSTLSKSFHDIFNLDKSSSDSTPTNSLSESNGFKYYCDNHKREITLTSDSCVRETTPQECDNGNVVSQKNKANLVHQSKATKNANLQSERRGSEKNGASLCKQLLRKELQKTCTNESLKQRSHLPSEEDIYHFHRNLEQSATMVFNNATGLPSRSSPAPLKRKTTGRFDYDSSLSNPRAIQNAISCSKLVLQSESSTTPVTPDQPRPLSTSAPASTNCLLGNFEESVLNGRIEPIGVVDGFTCDIGAGGSFCPKHVSLPVTAYFFQLSDDNAPSPYLGHINLESLGKKGYHIPKSGTVQVTLFNPNKTVVKMFVVMYDLSDMPPHCQTFLRQRTVYMPVEENSPDPSYLRYLIHLRTATSGDLASGSTETSILKYEWEHCVTSQFASSKSGKIFLHTDIRVLFARDKFEFDPRVAKYELRSFTEGPSNPKFSPKR